MFRLSPSILSADFANLARDVETVRSAGADFIHIDVMDGHFVPNITIGAPVVKALRKSTPMILDVHLMISDPDRYLDDFIKAGSDYITFHIEAASDPAALIDRIHAAGKRASISVKPATPVSALYPYLDILDMVLIMTVEPGFGGQGFIPETEEKIKELRAEIDRRKAACLLEIDGGVNTENALRLKHDGADVMVAGSAVFAAPDPAAVVKEFYRLCDF